MWKSCNVGKIQHTYLYRKNKEHKEKRIGFISRQLKSILLKERTIAQEIIDLDHILSGI
jgi:hypothetical protein